MLEAASTAGMAKSVKWTRCNTFLLPESLLCARFLPWRDSYRTYWRLLGCIILIILSSSSVV